MNILLKKSNPSGRVQVPASKSLTIRALFCASLASGESYIQNPLSSEDTEAAVKVLWQLGAGFERSGDVWRVRGGNLHASSKELHCGESATTMRLLIPVCALIPGRHVINGGSTLVKRPLAALIDALRSLGVTIQASQETYPPVIVQGSNLYGGETTIPGNISSQYISALLLAAPLMQRGLITRLTTPPASRPYIHLTIDSLKLAGIDVEEHQSSFTVRPQTYRPFSVRIESDWSSASYFVALGAGATDGLTIDNVDTNSRQGDRVIVDIAGKAGAQIETGDNSVCIARRELKPFSVDLADSIDLLPTTGILAAMANGTSELIGISAGRLKESNRVATVREGLEGLGIPVLEEENRLVITGPLPSARNGEPVAIDSHEDHRIAMAFGVLGALRGGISIKGAECVAKTFPGFWDVMKSAGVEMEIRQ